MNIVLGADQITEVDGRPQTLKAWMYTLKSGEKGGPETEIEEYTTQVVREGDTVVMELDNGRLGFWVNDTYLGDAYVDERLNSEEIFPSVMLGEGGHKIEMVDQ